MPVARRRLLPVLLALALASCNGGDGEEATPTTEPSVASTSTSTLPVDHHKPTAPRQAGSGLLEGTSPDGSSLYISAVDPSLSKVGCEGQPEPVLFRFAVPSGPRELPGPAGETFRGTIVRGRDGRVLVVTECEEFLSEVRIGTESPDGRFRDLRKLDLAQLRGLVSFAWSAEGDTLIAARTAVTRPAQPAGVVRVDPESSAVTPLFDVTGAVSQVGQLADGSYVVAGAGKVTVRDASGASKASYEGQGFALSADRRRLVAWGRNLVAAALGEPPVTLHTAPGTTQLGPAQFSPDGRTIAFATSVTATGTIVVVSLVDRRTTTVSDSAGRYVRLFFTGDGRALAFNRLAARPADDPAILVVTFGE